MLIVSVMCIDECVFSVFVFFVWCDDVASAGVSRRIVVRAFRRRLKLYC